MPNVFLTGPEQTHNGGVSAENVTLKIDGVDVAVAQQFQFTLTRNLNLLFEIGTTKTYYVGNRRQGQGQLNRVVAGASGFVDVMKKLGNMCAPVDVTLTGQGCQGGGGIVGAIAGAAGLGGGGTVTYKLKKATATSLGASVTAQDVIITESISVMFIDIDYS